ncbi:hypothetical protein HA402_003348 [Bradysia odoriphaga]|nr:hypothetical protein HA402_003348 [Bradysia odoriphaga]
MVDIQPILTPAELRAKEYMINMVTYASSKPCDIGNGNNIHATLPKWYDGESFRRGQKYFMDNRFGMLTSNLYGLFTLLADPKGLDVLDSTGRSSTPETAKNRYISTIVHMLSWYEDELRPDSKSWASLNRVRKMHLNASKGADKKKIGSITQTELALTTFGFMGFALVRPQFLGIRCDNKADREGFIHFWAVIGHMLGVDDEYNMCLFDIQTVEIICLIMIRYIFIPIIQLETPKFKEMTSALCKGLSPFMPHMSYDVQMFLVKRIIGVPGYQYNVDLSKEKICTQMFNAKELSSANEVVKMMHKNRSNLLKFYDILFHDGIPVTVPKKSVFIEIPANIKDVHNKILSLKHNDESTEIAGKKFHWIMKSTDSSDWKVHLHDGELSVLSKWDQLSVRWLCLMLKWYENSVGRYFCEMGLNAVLFFIRRYYDRNIARKSSK